MHDTLQRLFRYKAWADDELLTALARLGSGSPVTGLAIKALSHSYIVDRIFAAHLRRKAHAYTSANSGELPTLEQLSADMRKSDREYIDYVSALGPDQLAERIDFVFTDGAPGRMSREEMLMHVITHGVGHRGQVSAVMLLNSVPPAKDGFTTYLHEAEATTRGRLTEETIAHESDSGDGPGCGNGRNEAGGAAGAAGGDKRRRRSGSCVGIRRD